jgi:hypothetical protein
MVVCRSLDAFDSAAEEPSARGWLEAFRLRYLALDRSASGAMR